MLIIVNKECNSRFPVIVYNHYIATAIAFVGKVVGALSLVLNQFDDQIHATCMVTLKHAVHL